MWKLIDKYVIAPIVYLIRSIFIYQLDIKYLSQFETKKGYTLVVQISSKLGKLISIHRRKIKPKIILDKELVKEVPPDKLMYGEYFSIFESDAVFKAYLNGNSYGNIPASIVCSLQPKILHLLLRVEGPRSSNPSSRVQLGKVYLGVKIVIEKNLYKHSYLEIPLNTISLIAGDNNTKIIDS